LNDLRNLQAAVNSTNKMKQMEGRGHAQIALSYTLGDAYTLEYWTDMAKKIEEMGADSICIKDMAGLLLPYETYDLVKALKETVKLPIQLHTHYTAGVASMSTIKAIEAGVDVVDTAISPMAQGTSHMPTESLVAALAGTEYDTGINLTELNEVTKFFTPLREKYLADGLMDPKVMKVNVNALINQVPGGMLSNLVSQLKQAGKADLLDAVLEEVPRVRADAGYPPLVTPSSQIVGTQAVFNVLNGERYKMVTKEFRAMVRGEYGKTPVAMDPDFVKKIIGDAEQITGRPADALKPELDELRAQIPQYLEQDEDVLSYALFEQVALKFFEYRKQHKYGIDATSADAANGIHSI
jgi:oxaloacetate decarboxylase alpha subunit